MTKRKHIPWTLSSDGCGRVSVVLGSSYGTCMEMRLATSIEDMIPQFDFKEFLGVLEEKDGDLVGMLASGAFGTALFQEAVELQRETEKKKNGG